MRILEEHRMTGKKRLPGISPVHYGQEQCTPSFKVAVPRPYWLLHFVVSGKGVFQIGNTAVTVQSGQIFVIRPHQPHAYEADMHAPWHYMWVAFESDIPLPDILATDVITLPSARKLFTELFAANEMSVGKEEYVASRIWELISLLLRMENGKADRPNPYVIRAKQYFEENYMRDIKVADIAKEVCLDRSYFSAVFKKQTGISPQQYLHQYRLEQAAQLLAEGNSTVTAAAYRVGYNNIVNFSRMFKKHFGVPPSHYRALISKHEGSV